MQGAAEGPARDRAGHAGAARAVSRFHSPSPEATRSLAAALARAGDERGLVLALVGALGAGKTVFVKGLAAGLGIDPAHVASPTFVIASEYGRSARGGSRLAHLDLYRVERAGELEAAGFADLLAGSGIVAIEWADRFPGALPPDVLWVRLRRPAVPAGEEEREIEIEAQGPLAAEVLERLERT